MYHYQTNDNNNKKQHSRNKGNQRYNTASKLLIIGSILIILTFFWLRSDPKKTPLFSRIPNKGSSSSATSAGGGEVKVGGGRSGGNSDELLRQLAAANISDISEDQKNALPSWEQIQENVIGYNGPIVHGLERCEAFRAAIPGVERNIGCSGMFNSGTNLVTQLLKENCLIPERVEAYGMDGPFFDPQGKKIGPGEAHGIRWQVPWGKHVPAKYRTLHATKYATKIWKESVLAVVTIRHPYDWMKSTCKHHYSAYWPHNEKNLCPHLWHPKSKSLVPVKVKYDGNDVEYTSLADLWNSWYAEYLKDADFPYLVVRFEDLQFYAQNVTTQICECAGGVMRTDRPFRYIIESAKTGPGHGNHRTGMVDAWIKYGKPMPPQNNFNDIDYEYAQKELDAETMEMFGYKHPPPASPSSSLNKNDNYEE